MPGPVSATTRRDRLGGDRDRTARGRLAERVLDEVRRDLEQAVTVRLDPRLGPRCAERDPELARRRLVAADRLTCDLGEIDGLVANRELGPVHASEVEQVADEPLESPRLEPDRAGRLVGTERTVGETFRVAANRGQRRLQLVADREQEVPLGLARSRELLGHLIERQRARRARGSRRWATGHGARRRRGHGSRRRRGGSAGRSTARRRTRAWPRRGRRRAPPAAGRRGTGARPPTAGLQDGGRPARDAEACGTSRAGAFRGRWSGRPRRLTSGTNAARFARGWITIRTPPDSGFCVL